MCNVIMMVQLPDIWNTTTPLNNNRFRATMEAACRRTYDRLRFLPHCIPYAIAVMVMAPVFHTEDPNGVGDALNIFLFPYLYLSAGSEASLLTWKWDMI